MSFRDRLRHIVGIVNVSAEITKAHPELVEDLRDLLIRSERNDLIVNPDVPYSEPPAQPAPPAALPTGPTPEEMELKRRQDLVTRIGEKYGFPVDGTWAEAYYQQRISDDVLIAEQTRRNGGRAVGLE